MTAEAQNEKGVSAYENTALFGKKSKKTIARRISSIKSYYKYLNKKFGIECSFLQTIKTPKKDKMLPDLIHKDELQKILEYNHTGNFPFRNKAIIKLRKHPNINNLFKLL